MKSRSFLEQLVAAIALQQVGVRWFEALTEGSWQYKSHHSVTVNGVEKNDNEPIIFPENFNFNVPSSFKESMLDFQFTVEQMERLFKKCLIKLTLESVHLGIVEVENEITCIKLGFGFKVVDVVQDVSNTMMPINGYDTLLHLDWEKRKEVTENTQREIEDAVLFGLQLHEKLNPSIA